MLLEIDSSFLFLDGIQPFFGCHLSMWHSTKCCSSIFDLAPLMPKIYSPKLLAITLHYHFATRGRAVVTAALPGESRQSTKLRPLLNFGLGVEIQSPTGLWELFFDRYARKYGYPVLQHITLPRIGAIETMLNELSPLSSAAVDNGMLCCRGNIQKVC